MKKRNLMLMVIVLSLGVCANATTWNIYDDETINSGDYMSVSVFDTPPEQTVVDMYAGSISILGTYNTSIFNLYGGEVSDITLLDTSTVNLFGGTVSTIYPNTANVIVNGKNFSIIEGDYDFWVSGNWENETSFNIHFLRVYPTDPYVVLNEIPEPMTLLFLVSGSILALRNRKNNAKKGG